MHIVTERKRRYGVPKGVRPYPPVTCNLRNITYLIEDEQVAIQSRTEQTSTDRSGTQNAPLTGLEVASTQESPVIVAFAVNLERSLLR